MSVVPVILIVEDQAQMRRQLREFITLGFPEVFTAEAGNGAAALAACAAHRPDVALMDIELPDMDGISLTAQIRARFPAMRVIIVSHHTARVYLERAKAAGAFGYVSKDNVVTELLPLVRRALASA